MSFCLDPVFVTAPDDPSELAVRAHFPLNVRYDSTIQSMRRITLLAHNPLDPTATLDATTANRLFVGNDDLVFDLPGDRTLGSPPSTLARSPPATEPLVRASQGHTSWMATIVPKLDRVFAPLNPTGVNPTGEYTLSIIVFDRRLVDRRLFDSSGAVLPEVTWVNVLWWPDFLRWSRVQWW